MFRILASSVVGMICCVDRAAGRPEHEVYGGHQPDAKGRFRDNRAGECS